MDEKVTTNNNKTTRTGTGTGTGTGTTTTIGGTSVTKIIPYTNGVLKRHKHHQMVLVDGGVTYKECLKNHAASMGSHALDGCGEFMPAPTSMAIDPTSLKCAACGCHRNFHRQVPEKVPPSGGTRVIEYYPQHRHQPLPPPRALVDACQVRSMGFDDEESPPPISSTYYPGSAPHTLLFLSSGDGATTGVENNQHLVLNRKRFRTKFSQDQKDKMQIFAEKLEWKMLKSNQDLVNGFCNEIGVQRGVFKVWMHNNKNTIGKSQRSGFTNYGICVNQGGDILKNNVNHMEEDVENVNGNGGGNSHSSSINNSHTISLHQQSNGSSSTSLSAN